MFLKIFFVFCFIAIDSVSPQWCAATYQQCSSNVPCCSGYPDPLVCLRSGFQYYCYPYSEYLAYVNSQKSTNTITKPCAKLYERCDYAECCKDPVNPTGCASTLNGKYCFYQKTIDQFYSSTTTKTTSPTTPVTRATPAKPTNLTPTTTEENETNETLVVEYVI